MAQICTAVSPYPANDPCYIFVIAIDPFCCTTMWDGICQNEYDDCDPPGPGSVIDVSTNTYTIPQLVTDVLIGACVEVSNITSSGAALAFGSFTNGSSLGFENGIVLSSGNAVDAEGPDNGITSTAHGTPGDADLGSIAGVTTFDAAILEFDFIPTSDQINFEYVFGSDEYQDYTCGTVNDAFGFFITGPGYAPNTNVALVPGTSVPVSINTVNQGFASGFNNDQNCLDMDPNFAANSVYFNNNVNGPEISYNGYTDVFVAELTLVPCETYHIKLAIADGGDSGWDSGVFLKAGSFSAGLEVEVIAGNIDQTQDAFEGCLNGYFMFVNQGDPVTEPTDYTYTIGGTATMGVDYTNIPTTITFLPDQDTIFVNIDAFLDGVTEGIETIELTLPSECTCDPPTVVSLDIYDNEALTATISQDITICAGVAVDISLESEGSLAVPYSYSWSNGGNTSEISVSPLVTTTYTGTVTDACGTQSIDLQVTVTVASEIIVDIDEEICTGGSFTMPDGTTANTAGLYTFNFVTAQNCDSIVNINLSLIAGYDILNEISICEGEDYALPDGSIVNTSGTYSTLLTSVNGCDSLITHEITVNPIQTSAEFISICTGESYTLPNGTSIELAGSYNVTLASVSGCDSIVTYTLETTPVYGIALAETICDGDAFTLPDGTSTTTAGTYTYNFTTSNGCDSIVNLTLSIGTLEFSELAVEICEGENYLLPDGTSVDEAGYYEVLTAGGTCGILNQITVSVNPTSSTNINAQICGGASYVLPDGTSVSAAGIYTSNLTTSAGCDSIVVVDLSVVPINQTDLNIHLCSGETYTLPDGSIADANGNFDFVFPSATGCDSIINVSVYVHPTYDIVLNTVACDNQSVFDPYGNPITESGNYLLEYTSIWGCDSIVNLTITIKSTYSDTTEVEICNGAEFVTNGGQIIQQSGTYYDFLQTPYGCDSTLVYEVNVIPSQIALYETSPLFASAYNPLAVFTSNSLGADSTEWNFFDYGTYTDTIVSIQFGEVGSFHPFCLTIWNESGCASQLCGEFEVREEFAVFIPNAFSPNGDGVNDLFSIEGQDIDPNDFLLQIFNRWGELIFESNSPSIKWNGTFNGSSDYFAQEEVYVYQARIGSLATGEIRAFSGSVTVIR
jgi:gliding motility-associated-like protein